MNKKGFTLVELLAVFVILALLLLIVVPSILGFLNKAEVEFTEAQKRLIIQSATLYIEDHKNEIPELKQQYGTYKFTLQILGDEGYINLPLYDSKSKSEVDATTVHITVTKNEYGRFEYAISGVR